nr:reverse transcriptase domain-containing protein [Tanacetum cinerariifolium]
MKQIDCFSSDANSSSSSEIAKLTHAVNQQKSVVTTAMTTILKQFQETPPPASLKAIEEICVTCSEEYEHAEETLTDPELAEYTIKVPPPLKMLKALLSNKEKLLELENTPLNENYSAVILKKLLEKLGDPGKFLILCGLRKMILREGDERLTLNMRHDTSSYSNQPHKESINMINIYNDSYEDYLKDFTTSSSLDHLLEEFADELALITFPLGNDDLPFDIESDLREFEYFLNHDPTKEIDSNLEDSVDKCNLADPNNDLVDTIPEMFTNEHTLDYSSLPLYNDFNDDLVELKSDNNDVYNDPFDSKEDKIKESKLLIDELDPPRSSDFLPSLECDSVSL